jgi:molecular chaperone GrpE
MPGDAAENHEGEAREKGEGGDLPLGAGAFGDVSDVSDDEIFKEWLAEDEAAGAFKGGAEEGGLPGARAPGEEVSMLAAKIADLEAQLAEAREQQLRKAADFENFRKRMNQEKQRAIEFANENLLLDIIQVIDDFERAIQSAERSAELAELPAGKAMLDGISMIEKRLIGQLESKWGLTRFSSAGAAFDPNFHEAMFMEKSREVEEPTVTEDFAKGYTLKGRVIRAAKVKVLMPEDGSAEAQGGSEG